MVLERSNHKALYIGLSRAREIGLKSGWLSHRLFPASDPVAEIAEIRPCTACGTGPVVERLSRDIQDAWLAFARSGDPSTPGLGQWPPYGRDRLTMLVDKESRVAAAPFEEERRAWDSFDMLSTPPL